MYGAPQNGVFRSDFSYSYSCQEGAPPAWLLRQPRFQHPSDFKFHACDFGLPAAPMPWQTDKGNMCSSKIVGQTCDVFVDALCEAKPSFEKGPDGTYIMNFSGIDVKVTTTCTPSPSLVSGVSLFRPQEDFHISLPDVQRVVFNPWSRDTASLSRHVSVPKHLMVLELAKEHSLNVKLNADAPRGRLVIEDVRTIGHHREVTGEMALHYELSANGRLSVNPEGNYHQLHVDFDFDFRCWLVGSMPDPVAHHVHFDMHAGPMSDLVADKLKCDLHAASIPRAGRSPDFGVRFEAADQNIESSSQTSNSSVENGSHTVNSSASTNEADEGRPRRADFRRRGHLYSYNSDKALSQLSSTEDELEYLEDQVADLMTSLQGASAAEALQVKTELSQLEAKAKALETKGIDDVYTGELNSGKQLAKQTKKDMLRRLEQLFVKMDDAFAQIKAKHS